jgi:hypothetical protein
LTIDMSWPRARTDVLEWAAGALANISGGMPDIQQRAAGAGAVEALEQLCNSSREAGVVASAMDASAALCSGVDTAAATQLQGAAPHAPAAPAAAAASSPRPPQQPRTCAVCGKPQSRQQKLQRCAGCHSVRYCSTDCQRAHWREHRKDCAGGAGRRTA